MTIKVGNCEICGDYDKLGLTRVPKTGLRRYLCSWCISQLLKVSEKEARKEIERQLESMYQQVVSKV
jgi:uncharacterized protein with PIN domain